MRFPPALGVSTVAALPFASVAHAPHKLPEDTPDLRRKLAEPVCYATYGSGQPCINGDAPTCSQIQVVDVEELCASGYWLTPERGTLESTFPLSITVTDGHNEGTSPETNDHWHAYCTTSSGVERVSTSAGQGSANVWASAAEEASCSGRSDLPTSDFRSPTISPTAAPTVVRSY
jgi:hypothetical protein